MIPPFDSLGNLPPGIHRASWKEFKSRFGWNEHRKKLLSGLDRALKTLTEAGCKTVYIDGSFVTAKEKPGDYDGCWSIKGITNQSVAYIDPVLLDFSQGRAAQKAKYYGEMFPAEGTEAASGKTWLEFFQVDKKRGDQKGIVMLKLRRKK
jgi:hypothetical protein